jgi:hypothetical protein
MTRALYAAAIGWLSWLLMQAVHELGHVLAAGITGATVERVVLHPLTISRTDVAGERFPLMIVWGGPVVGILVPLTAWWMVRQRPTVTAHAAGFFAGFCLIANGAYLAYGSFDGIGDAGELLSLGIPRWVMWLFGAVTIPAGFAIWHRLGNRLGFGEPTLSIRRRHVLIAWLIVTGVVIAEAALSLR